MSVYTHRFRPFDQVVSGGGYIYVRLRQARRRNATVWCAFNGAVCFLQAGQQTSVDAVKRHEVDRLLNSQSELMQHVRDLRQVVHEIRHH